MTNFELEFKVTIKNPTNYLGKTKIKSWIQDINNKTNYKYAAGNEIDTFESKKPVGKDSGG